MEDKVSKKQYQEVESELMMLKSENTELKFAIINAKTKLKKAIEILDNVDVTVKV